MAIPMLADVSAPESTVPCTVMLRFFSCPLVFQSSSFSETVLQAEKILRQYFKIYNIKAETINE